MLKVGVIGLGVGEKHANVYANDSRCQLTGICDFNHKKLKNLKSKYPNVKIYKNDNSKLLGKRVLKQEHVIYPIALKKLISSL